MVPDAAGRQQQPGRVQPARRRLAKAPQQVAHRVRQAESTKRHAVAGGNTRASSGRARGPERTQAAARAMRRAEAPRVGLLQLGQACDRTRYLVGWRRGPSVDFSILGRKFFRYDH